MIIRIDEQIEVEVSFSPTHREDGHDDDIRFCIREDGPQNMRIFSADTTTMLLTPRQAEELAVALTQVAAESRQAPK